MEPDMIIKGAIAIIVGLILLPLIATFIAQSKANNSTSAITGLPAVLDLIAYGFAFGLVGAGISMVTYGFKK